MWKVVLIALAMILIGVLGGAAPASARTLSHRGSGERILRIARASVAVDVTNEASSSFAIWAYHADFSDLLVNVIGTYKGQSVLAGKAVLAITADGNWTIVTKWGARL